MWQMGASHSDFLDVRQDPFLLKERLLRPVEAKQHVKLTVRVCRYENASQFSRAYSRLFGAPPQRDVTRMRLAPVARPADLRRTIARSTARGTGPNRRSTRPSFVSR
jgi:AraC-like DNA-binding protein